MSVEEDCVSGLAFIHVENSNPFVLFNEWRNELDGIVGADPASQLIHNTFNLATTSADGKVGNRSVLLRDIDNGFIFSTDKRGRKMKDIEASPYVAGTFFWHYIKDGILHLKQVRFEGTVQLLDEKICQKMYDNELPFCKIRAHLCHQGLETNWEDLKKEHDDLLRQYLNKETDLPRPDHYVILKIVPNRMEFFYSYGKHIGDRLAFTKSGDNWKYVRLVQ